MKINKYLKPHIELKKELELTRIIWMIIITIFTLYSTVRWIEQDKVEGLVVLQYMGLLMVGLVISEFIEIQLINWKEINKQWSKVVKRIEKRGGKWNSI